MFGERRTRSAARLSTTGGGLRGVRWILGCRCSGRRSQTAQRAAPRRRACLLEQLGGEARGGAARAPRRRVVFGRGDVFGRRGEEVEVGDWRVSLDAEALQGCGGGAG